MFDFSFNFHSSLLLIGFVQAFTFAFLLFRRYQRNEQLSDKLLALLLVSGAIFIANYMLAFGGFYREEGWYAEFMFYFPFQMSLLFGPLFYFYFRSLTNQAFKFTKADIKHFWPAIIYLVVRFAIFINDIIVEKWIQGKQMSDWLKSQGSWGHLYENHGPEDFVDIFGSISSFVYLFFTIKIYAEYRRYLNENHSETSNIEFAWLRNALIAFGIGMTIIFAIDITDTFFEKGIDYTTYWYAHMALAIMLYYISIQGYTQTAFLPKSLAFEPQHIEVQPQKTTPEIKDFELLKAKVEAAIQKEIYLNPELTLKELANELKTNTSVLSKVINQGFGQNFNDFINTKRVEKVKATLLSKTQNHLTLTGIAYECGFNSKATFNRAFRKFTGQTPKEFMSQNL